MNNSSTDITAPRNCPLCGGTETGMSYPYSTQFNDVLFSYLKCSSCASVFVDPIPNEATFSKMYSKSTYHDQHYLNNDSGEYADSVLLLGEHLDSGSLVLDYGCGTGEFLKALSAAGFLPFGVEFDEEVAVHTSIQAGCNVLNVGQYSTSLKIPMFDAIHFGDVLEHLPDPITTLKGCFNQLKPGGVLFVEGPLETNASPVYWASILFGSFKHLVFPETQANYPPTHLYRTASEQQKAFFYRVSPDLDLRYWQVYETGWPYSGAGHARSIISKIAIMLSGKRFFGSIFGNRFKAIFLKPVIVPVENGSN